MEVSSLRLRRSGGTSKKQQHITQLSDPSLRIAGKPFLTAYAQGVNNTDAGKTYIWTGAPYENTTVDDIGYVYDIIRNVSSDYSVDPSRIYANGKSNGGGFTNLLACRPDTSSLFAAFAPVSPALYAGTHAFHNCTPSRPVPIFHTHGIEDTVAPFYGRAGGSRAEPDVRVWRRQWAERNGCAKGQDAGKLAPQPDSVEEVHEGVWQDVWNCTGAEVRSLSVEGLGHSWPTTLGLDTAGSPNQTANFNLTSQHLVQFYSRHSLDD
ncbi:hypothetical protein SLS53_006135 [Cytospora paraplurivora]|uniref:feruloyl esterase n=1 Tax=Cytospora paraplurivora TaxID=2898453 RepID=A0AAN9U5S9_9PEZI